MKVKVWEYEVLEKKKKNTQKHNAEAQMLVLT